MNKTELIHKISKQTEVPLAVVSGVLDAMSQAVTKAVTAGETVDLHGLCKLKVELRPERNGRNPATGAAILIPEKSVVKITPAKSLTAAANN